MHRLAALASATLMRMGAGRPGDHVAIVRARPAEGPDAPDGIGTILVSRDLLSAADLDTLDSVAARLNFEVVQSPRRSADETFAGGLLFWSYGARDPFSSLCSTREDAPARSRPFRRRP